MVSDNTQGDLEVARALRFSGASGVVPAPLGNCIWVDGSGNLRLALPLWKHGQRNQ